MGKEDKIFFETKKEANKRRRKEVLNRPPETRLSFFLNMVEESIFQSDLSFSENKNNFIIE